MRGPLRIRSTLDLVTAPRRIRFSKAKDVPNSRLPVLLFRGGAGTTRERQGSALQAKRLAGPVDRYDLRYTHFHSNAHEVLGIAEGRVAIRLGGEEGSLFRLKAGDMLILPAGVGHRRVGSDEGLKVIGAYPRGQSHFDVKRRDAGCSTFDSRLPIRFNGENGPLMQAWTSGRTRQKPLG